MLSDKIKKNLLDLNYNKYLQYYNTSLILLFTYIIALSVGFLTGQINIFDFEQMIVVATLSLISISILINLLIKFKDHLTKIPQEIKRLTF